MIQVRPPTLQLPYDLARWGLETTFREGLPPDEPEVLRLLAGVSWRAERRLTPARAALMLDEVRRTFRVSVRTAESAVREGYDLAMQSRLESLVVPRLGSAKIREWVRVRGALPGRCLVVVPHAGNLTLLVAALAWANPGLVVFTARGVPPRARRGLGAIRNTWINRHLAEVRKKEQTRLPVLWEEDPAAIPHAFAEGRVVVCAFDDRAWRRYRRVPFFEREALISDEPFELARTHGVPLVPASIQREHDKTHTVHIGAPFPPELGRYLAEVAEPLLASLPGHYATWLTECRMRAAMDDHPLFADYAPDARWMRWPEGLDGPGNAA